MTNNNFTELEEALKLHFDQKFDKAEKIYEKIINREENNFNALYLLGTIKAQKKKYEEAIFLIRKSLSINQNNFIALSNLGTIFFNINRYEDAITEFNNSILLNPKYSDSYNGLGNVYRKQKKYLLALTNYKKSIRLNEKFYIGYYNIVILLLGLEKYNWGQLFLDKLIISYPNNYENYYLQGIIYKRLQKFELAKKSLLKSIELNPSHEKSYNEIGCLYYFNKDFKNALSYMKKCANVNPNFKEIYLNIGIVCLLNENYTEGWKNFCKGKNTKQVISKKPLWTGQLDSKNKKIFIYSEQGLGDVIQFTRYLFILINYFDKIIFKIPNTLKYLLSGINSLTNNKIELVTDFEKIDECDFHLPLINLTLFFKEIPTEINYFNIDQKYIVEWSKKLSNKDYKIGICWKAGKQKEILSSEFATERSFTLNQFAKIISLDKVMLINLQKEYEEDQKNSYYNKIKIFKEMDVDRPLMDTAAIIMNCNLIITCDTSIAHLAGTLGIKTFLILNYNNHWVWGVDKNYCRWYKNVKIFRQDKTKSWDEPFNQVYNIVKSSL
jgi:tetratricopeptide (TPR) repeat protein